ncbi:hypothetical protein [Streptomyces mirabilis]
MVDYVPSPDPRCTGEEMALHLGIARAEGLTRNRPRLVRETVADLPQHRRDFDWTACSAGLFEDHDVLMLFDDSLDGVEDSGSDVNRPWAWSTSRRSTGSLLSTPNRPAPSIAATEPKGCSI